jgi:hypothetical protein
MTPAGIARLKLDEGSKSIPYDDRSGVAMIVGPNGGNITVGYGHNLSVPMSSDLTNIIFNYDLSVVEMNLSSVYPWYRAVINTVPGDVLAMVEYNTGKLYQFAKMLAAAQLGDMTTMSAELLDSAAARQLPARYTRMSQALLANSWASATANERTIR